MKLQVKRTSSTETVQTGSSRFSLHGMFHRICGWFCDKEKWNRIVREGKTVIFSDIIFFSLQWIMKCKWFVKWTLWLLQPQPDYKQTLWKEIYSFVKKVEQI